MNDKWKDALEAANAECADLRDRLEDALRKADEAEARALGSSEQAEGEIYKLRTRLDEALGNVEANRKGRLRDSEIAQQEITSLRLALAASDKMAKASVSPEIARAALSFLGRASIVPQEIEAFIAVKMALEGVIARPNERFQRKEDGGEDPVDQVAAYVRATQ